MVLIKVKWEVVKINLGSTFYLSLAGFQFAPIITPLSVRGDITLFFSIFKIFSYNGDHKLIQGRVLNPGSDVVTSSNFGKLPSSAVIKNFIVLLTLWLLA